MPAYIMIPAVVVMAAIFIAVVVGPTIWLTRSPRAIRFRGIKGTTLLVWWILAAIPWAVVLVLLQAKHTVGISADGIPALLLLLSEAIVVCAALLSLPLAVIVLTVLWILDHEAVTR